MQLLFFTEARLFKDSNGTYFSADQSFSYQMFKRYLGVFDKVCVVARVLSQKHTYNDNTVGAQVNGERVEVLPLPYYVGPFQYLIKRKKIVGFLKGFIDAHPAAAIICRVPGAIGTDAYQYLKSINRPFAVEVVGDPHDAFAPKSIKHPLRPLFRKIGVQNLKAVVRKASAAMYVTKKSLQLRYPAGKEKFSTYASDVDLPPAAIAQEAKKLHSKSCYSLVAVGSLSALYKGPDLAIEALAILKEKNLNVTLKWIGDGQYKGDMINRVINNNMTDIVTFNGGMASAGQVMNQLDRADIFILPSRTEGLPRALVEAMARGLPCIGTDVGGIPELLSAIALVPVNNPAALADKIHEFLTTPGLADAEAMRNLSEARNYASAKLESNRNEFYHYLKAMS